MPHEPDVIQFNYPDAVPEEDFSLENTGQGVTAIRRWNEAKLGPKPDLAALPAPDAAFYERRKYQALDADLDNKALKAVVAWAAQRFGITPARAREEIRAIHKGL